MTCRYSNRCPTATSGASPGLFAGARLRATHGWRQRRSSWIQVFEQTKEAVVLILGAAAGPLAAGAVVALKETALLSGITYRAGS